MSKTSTIDTRTVTVAEAKSRIMRCLKVRRPAFLWGPPGVGKSELVGQIASDLGGVMVDFRLAIRQPTDIMGIPFYNKDTGTMDWAPPIDLPSEEFAKQYPIVVLFLDEMNSAAPAVQAAAYQLVLDRRVGQYRLPDNVMIVAAGNRVKGALSDTDWDEVLQPGDRAAIRRNDAEVARQSRKPAFEATEVMSDWLKKMLADAGFRASAIDLSDTGDGYYMSLEKYESSVKPALKAAGYKLKPKTRDVQKYAPDIFMMKGATDRGLSFDFYDDNDGEVCVHAFGPVSGKESKTTANQIFDHVKTSAEDYESQGGRITKTFITQSVAVFKAEKSVADEAKSKLLRFYGLNESVETDELSEAVNVKAFKIEVPDDLEDDEIWDFINDQSVVTIEDFKRKGNIVYLYPHFEHDYDPHMTGVMQSAFNRYLKDYH